MEETDASCNNCSVNDTLTDFRCGIPPFLPPTIPPAFDYLQGAIFVTVNILSLLLNGLVVFLVAYFKSLQQRTFYLAIQLIFLHLVLSVTLLPIAVTNAFARKCVFGDDVCYLQGILLTTLLPARFLLTLVLTLDRFITVFMPFFYAKYGGKISTGMSLVAWIFSFIRGIVNLPSSLDCIVYVPAIKLCITAPTCSNECYGLITGTLFIAAMLGPVSFILYIVLFWKAKKIQTQIQPLPSNSSNSDVATQRAQHNRRAMITFLILFIALVGCFAPSFALLLVRFADPVSKRPTPTVIILQMLLAPSFNGLTIADPIAIMRNQDVRDALRVLKSQLGWKTMNC